MSPTKRRGIRAGLEVCRTMECWAGKLRGEACPPCWANAGVYKQASDSHCNLAHSLRPPALAFVRLWKHLLLVGMVSGLGSPEGTGGHRHFSVGSREERSGEKK